MAIEVVKLQEFKGHSQAVYAMAVHLKSNTIFSGSGDGMLVQWEIGKEDGRLIVKMESSIYALACKDDLLYIGTRTGDLAVFSILSNQLLNKVSIDTSPIFELLPFGNTCLIATGDGQLILMRDDLKRLKQVKVSGSSVRSLLASESGFIAGTSNGEIIELDADLNVLSNSISHQGTVFALAYDSKTKTLFSGGKDAYIKMFANGGEIASVPAHTLHVHRLCINSSGDRLLSSSMDKTIKLWDTNGLRLLKVIEFERDGGHRSSVNKILWIDKNTIISCSDDRTLMCFEFRET